MRKMSEKKEQVRRKPSLMFQLSSPRSLSRLYRVGTWSSGQIQAIRQPRPSMGLSGITMSGPTKSELGSYRLPIPSFRCTIHQMMRPPARLADIRQIYLMQTRRYSSATLAVVKSWGNEQLEIQTKQLWSTSGLKTPNLHGKLSHPISWQLTESLRPVTTLVIRRPLPLCLSTETTVPKTKRTKKNRPTNSGSVWALQTSQRPITTLLPWRTTSNHSSIPPSGGLPTISWMLFSIASTKFIPSSMKVHSGPSMRSFGRQRLVMKIRYYSCLELLSFSSLLAFLRFHHVRCTLHRQAFVAFFERL